MQLNKGNSKRHVSIFAGAFLALYTLFAVFVGGADYVIPDEITVTAQEIENASAEVRGISESTVVEANLFGSIPVKNVKVNVVKDSTLVPCGDVFGIKFFTKGVLIVKLSDIETKDGHISPAGNAGLSVGDVIQSIDGSEVNTVEQMSAIVENSKGRSLAVTYERNGEEKNCVITPLLSLSDKKYKTGIWVRDSTAGIGTMTYYNPRTKQFAGLGHGICDVDTGILMPLLEGSVVDVQITDIIKGRRGAPGELKGSFDRKKQGSVISNTSHGVYGNVNEDFLSNKKAFPIGFKDEVKEGKAKILCELDENGVKEYSINIVKINGSDEKDKNFVIEVEDENLIAKTGGIVQGMSGSPIIQNGKIIGAVTHVLVNNPGKGYGIFIENMLCNE